MELQIRNLSKTYGNRVRALQDHAHHAPRTFGLLGPNGAMHRIKSGAQRIVIDVRGRPTAAGIDSRHLMIDTDPSNNTLPIGKPR